MNRLEQIKFKFAIFLKIYGTPVTSSMGYTIFDLEVSKIPQGSNPMSVNLLSFDIAQDKFMK